VNGPGFDFCVEDGRFPVTRIIVFPGDPGESFLMTKLTSTREDLCPAGHHPRMPPPPWAALPPSQIELFRTWIEEGAMFN